jgi:steroid delta-isomerase-like uncharacterized protein
MSAKEIKALTRRFFTEWNKGKEAAMTVMDELYATDVVFHWSTGEDIRGLKKLKQLLSEFYDAFPDNHMTLDEMIVEEDMVAIRYTISGTHKGEYHGIPPTNKKVTMWVIEIDRIAGHKCVEGWERSDTLGMMQQLGVPKPRKGK